MKVWISIPNFPRFFVTFATALTITRIISTFLTPHDLLISCLTSWYLSKKNFLFNWTFPGINSMLQALFVFFMITMTWSTCLNNIVALDIEVLKVFKISILNHYFKCMFIPFFLTSTLVFFYIISSERTFLYFRNVF